MKLLLTALVILLLAACSAADTEADEAAERMRRWSADIEQFEAHIIRWHPRFASRLINERDCNIEIREQFEAGISALLENLDGLSDFEIHVEMQRIVAILRDNHFFFTGFAGYTSDLRLIRYPLVFGNFSDGVYLYQSYADFAHALNQRLVAVNGVPLDEVFAEFKLFWSVENIYDARYQFAALLNAATVLRALGISCGEGVTYTFEGGAEFTVIDARPWESMMTTLRWLPPVPLVDARAEGDLPLFRQNIRQNLWHEFVEEYGILFVSIRGWVPDTQGIFARAVQNTFDNNNVAAVIIDARSNPGGDANQFIPLFNHFAQNLPKGMLFYFVNEGSNSGSLGAAFFLENLGAVIIGQPLAQNSDFFWFGSNASRLWLNYSRMEITPPPTLWSAYQVHRRQPEDGIFRPHVLIEYTISDWINNHDPMFDYVLQRITNGTDNESE